MVDGWISLWSMGFLPLYELFIGLLSGHPATEQHFSVSSRIQLTHVYFLLSIQVCTRRMDAHFGLSLSFHPLLFIGLVSPLTGRGKHFCVSSRIQLICVFPSRRRMVKVGKWGEEKAGMLGMRPKTSDFTRSNQIRNKLSEHGR